MMSINDYDFENNEGQGFVIDDDDDLDSMLSFASQGEEKDQDSYDPRSFSAPEVVNPPTQQSSSPVPPPQEVVEEVVVENLAEPTIEKAETYNPTINNSNTTLSEIEALLNAETEQDSNAVNENNNYQPSLDAAFEEPISTNAPVEDDGLKEIDSFLNNLEETPVQEYSNNADAPKTVSVTESLDTQETIKEVEQNYDQPVAYTQPEPIQKPAEKNPSFEETTPTIVEQAPVERKVETEAAHQVPEVVHQKVEQPIVKNNYADSNISLDETSKIIAILDTYRSLTTEEKLVSAQLITNSDVDLQDKQIEAKLIIATLGLKNILEKTIKTLLEAKKLDPVERAFYVIDLDDEVLYPLGSLVSAFFDKEIEPAKTRINYSRELVSLIEELTNETIDFIKATEKILDSAKL